MNPQRPALAEVLAVLTDRKPDIFADPGFVVEDGGVRLDPSSPKVTAPWRCASTRELVEALVMRGLAPAHWIDPQRRPQWVHEWCFGCRRFEPRHVRCPRCQSYERNHEIAADPPTGADVMAVFCLGAEALTDIEATVAAAWPSARLTWWPRTRDALEGHHLRIAAAPLGPHMEFSCEQTLPESRADRWPAAMPTSYASPYTNGVWPALRALAAARVHLLDKDSFRAVLGVEMPVENPPFPAGATMPPEYGDLTAAQATYLRRNGWVESEEEACPLRWCHPDVEGSVGHLDALRETKARPTSGGDKKAKHAP